jgi:hypothetical protein
MLRGLSAPQHRRRRELRRGRRPIFRIDRLRRGSQPRSGRGCPGPLLADDPSLLRPSAAAGTSIESNHFGTGRGQPRRCVTTSRNRHLQSREAQASGQTWTTSGTSNRAWRHHGRPAFPQVLRLSRALITQRTRVQIPPPRRRGAAERRPVWPFYLRKQLSCHRGDQLTPGFLFMTTVRIGQHQSGQRSGAWLGRGGRRKVRKGRTWTYFQGHRGGGKRYKVAIPRRAGRADIEDVRSP